MKKYWSFNMWFIRGLLVGFFVLMILRCSPAKKEKDYHKGEKIVVLTFDDAVKSHLTLVAPLLNELNFGATFFISYAFMDDSIHFLTWTEVAQLHNMGFEIGNHSWTHPDFSQPVNAAALAGELGLINWQLMIHGVPKPVSFAWTGNGFGPEALEVLHEQGIKFARRGMQPEVPYGSLHAGPAFNPEQHHQLLIPTTRDAYPEMTMQDFIDATELAEDGKIVVLQFHGVPDPIHPWVHTDSKLFKKCMLYLKDNKFKVIGMNDLEKYLPEVPPNDSLIHHRYVLGNPDHIIWPEELIATHQNLDFWIYNMIQHGYSIEEMKKVCNISEDKLLDRIKRIEIPEKREKSRHVSVLPYPGGRHPRIGFHEGMLSPMRGTKASIFLPWDPEKYLVLDLPEAVFTQFGLTFLGHKHIPTVFDLQKTPINNHDWTLHPDGQLTNQWELPNQLVIGAEIKPEEEEINLSLWLYNGTDDTAFTDLQTQICIMFKGADDFDVLTNDNKLFHEPVTAVRSTKRDQWILTAWDRCSHAWGNPDCPCMHADPRFPDCLPGDTVRLSGKIWFYHGENIEGEIKLGSLLYTGFVN